MEKGFQKAGTAFGKTAMSINLRGEMYSFNTPKLMGIINATPDSFYDAGRNNTKASIKENLEMMAGQGVDIIDIGAFSSRPGAKIISEDEEMSRLVPVLSVARKDFPELYVSVDTFRAGIAKRVVEDFGVDIINDISAGSIDRTMFETIARLQVPYILMHMQGVPENMQDDPRYNDVVQDVIKFLAEKKFELNLMGVKDILVDPGFGFGKALDHNYRLLAELKEFAILDSPLIVGISRKSMISRLLNIKTEESLNASTVAHSWALMNGADILRVHDVKAAREAIELISKLNSFSFTQ